MFAWLRRLGKPNQAPFLGAPAVRRLKTYSADSGYVYQYYFEGSRSAPDGEPGVEYAFSFSADRKTYASARVFVGAEALDLWRREGGRELTSSERYAVAKIALFQAFDERSKPAEMLRPVRVSRGDLDAIAERLGLL